jgi:hypothetical protein
MTRIQTITEAQLRKKSARPNGRKRRLLVSLFFSECVQRVGSHGAAEVFSNIQKGKTVCVECGRVIAGMVLSLSLSLFVCFTFPSLRV